MRFAVSCLLVMGCGRFGFAPIAGDSGDGSLDTGDATLVTPCATWSAYSVVVDDPLSSPGTDDWIPHISFDGLSLIQDEYNGTDFDLGVSRRATIADAFPSPSALTGADVNGVTEQAGQFSPDESRLYLFRYTGSIYELWQYERVGDMYMPEFRHVQQTDVQHFWVSEDELRVYTIETRGNDGVIVQAERTDLTQQFGAGTDIFMHVGRPGMSLTLSSDELEMIVSLPETVPTDDLDVYYGSRATRSDPFGAVTPILELLTSFDDVIGSWSRDRTTAYLNLNTDVTGGRDADVWVATRTCLD